MSNVIAVDTETTSLRPDRRVWEVALILPAESGLGFRFGSRAEERPGHFRWFIDKADLDLGNADPFALKVGGFYERHPQLADDARGHVTSEADVLRQVERITRGAHLLGAVPNFDADVLDRRMRAHGIAPSWHYHLIDIEAMAVGYLAGLTRGAANATGESEEDLLAAAGIGPVSLPWKSEDLSRACGVEPASEEERHTALGDAAWALRLYEAITGGKP